MINTPVKCTACQEAIKRYGHRSPVGYEPFGWGREGDEHYYIYPEENQLQVGVSYPVAIEPICKVEAEARPPLLSMVARTGILRRSYYD